MAFLAIDTETTGLPKYNRASYTNTQAYDTCRVLSVAIVTYDDHGVIKDTFHSIIYPDNFKVAATEIHGITQEHAQEVGRPFEIVFRLLLEKVREIPHIVGHNIEFDLNVLKAEAVRRQIPWGDLSSAEVSCTFKMAKTFYGKPIKLINLYEKIFNNPFDNAHNALADARASGDIFVYFNQDPRKAEPIETKKVYIKVSDVAACIGHHRYKSVEEVMNDLWVKYNPATFTGKTKLVQSMEAFKCSETAQKILEDVEKVSTENSNDAEEIYQKAKSAIEADIQLTPKQKGIVNDHLRGILYTTHGTKHEMNTAVKLGDNLETDDTFYKFPICEIAGTKYILCGKIDRWEKTPEGEKILVEIKNRIKGLFKTVRTYEKIQVQVYLKLTGATKAKLVEQFNDEIASYDIQYSDKLWTTSVLPGLQEFCKTLHSNMCSNF
jgi:DNA polymerase III epsilon subunit-like protein